MITASDRTRLRDLPIDQVAEALGLNVKNYRAICPFHDDRNPSLRFNFRTNRYCCFVCGSWGNTIDLVMGTKHMNYPDSCRWLASTFGITLEGESGRYRKGRKKGTSRKKGLEPQPVPPKPKVVGSEMTPDTEYLAKLMENPYINGFAARFLYKERKIRQDVVKRLGLSSITYNTPMGSDNCYGFFDGPALLIPYRDIDGRLISVQSRFLGGEGAPRFRFPKGSRCHVFNIDSLKGLDKNVPVYITEGVTDCLATLSSGFTSIAIPSATLLKSEDVELFKDRNLHMYPDADEPGEKLYGELKALCPQLVRHELPLGFKDFGQYYSAIN